MGSSSAIKRRGCGLRNTTELTAPLLHYKLGFQNETKRGVSDCASGQIVDGQKSVQNCDRVIGVLMDVAGLADSMEVLQGWA